jgi:hypothetical protein
MKHHLTHHLALALCGLVLVTASFRPAAAQDDPADDLLPRTGPGTIVWCSIQSDQQLFITGLARVANPSPVVIGAYGGRFGRTINARYGLHVGLENNYCRSFRNHSAAAAARANMIQRTAALNVRIVDVSIY